MHGEEEYGEEAREKRVTPLRHYTWERKSAEESDTGVRREVQQHRGGHHTHALPLGRYWTASAR